MTATTTTRITVSFLEPTGATTFSADTEELAKVGFGATGGTGLTADGVVAIGLVTGFAAIGSGIGAVGGAAGGTVGEGCGGGVCG